MKILITGGHITPALAVIDALMRTHRIDDLKIIFTGRKYFTGNKSPTLEFKQISKRGILFIDLRAGRLTRLINLRSFLNFLKTPIGFFQSFYIVFKEKPDMLLTFGGYLALPVAFACYFSGIPVFMHEQTIRPGITNRIISRLAKKIFISFEETSGYFPSQKTILTGNPVRKTIFQIVKKPFHVKKNKPVIYISGGSLGSHSVNLLIEKIAGRLLDKFILIHQAGDVAQYADFERLSQLKRNMPFEKRNNYFLKKHFLEEESGYIYSVCDLLVGRSGANTFFELAALKIPAVFIPLPWSSAGEQMEHAKIFQKHKTGEIFDQSDSPENLLKLITSTISKLDFYKNNFISMPNYYKTNAEAAILRQILG